MSPNKKLEEMKTKEITTRENIKELRYVRRMTMQKVADALGISKRTVVRYCKELDKEIANTIKERDVRELLNLRSVGNDKAIERLWRTWDDEKDPYKKAHIIARIEKCQNDMITSLQILGNIPATTMEQQGGKKIVEVRWIGDEGDNREDKSRHKVQASRKTKAVSRKRRKV